MTFSPEDIGRVEKQWAEKAQAMLDTVSARAKESGVRVKTATANSDLVAESIIAAAKKHKSDLIVMASHGRKGIKRLLLAARRSTCWRIRRCLCGGFGSRAHCDIPQTQFLVLFMHPVLVRQRLLDGRRHRLRSATTRWCSGPGRWSLH